MPAFAHARAVLADGLAARAFPAATVDVGRAGGSLWREAVGRRTFDAESSACRLDAIFDLASLTKVVATASIAMAQIRSGRWTLETPVGHFQPAWRHRDRGLVTIRHLLEHSSGLPAHAPLWRHASGREAFERAIDQIPLEAPPGTRAMYSDLGFILLGFLLEGATGEPLDAQFERLSETLSDPPQFRPSALLRDRIAPTEQDAWRGRLLHGEVHDENAAALGGVAGHAGLFGTAEGVGEFARLVLRTFHETTPLGTPELMRTFAEPSRVPGSSRALAWDTMRPTSSCGTRMSPAAIGHTGFTGTSLWIDPAQDVYVVLLTNRVHPTREHNALAALRPGFHDAVMEDVSK